MWIALKRLAAYAVAAVVLVDFDWGFAGRRPRRIITPAPKAAPRPAPRPALAAAAPPLPLPLAIGRSGLPAAVAPAPIEAALVAGERGL